MLETKATLRIFSSVRTLSELVGTLGPPSRGFSKGDSSGPGRQPREQTYWAWGSTSAQTAPLETHLEEVLAFIASIGEFEPLRQDCEIDVFCRLATTNGQGGASISHRVMARMAALELNLSLDIYGDSEVD
jgi:hypothetical protein